jgi:mannose-6-phosphate isomerase-like protein (cupin superfamily)
MTPIHFHVNDTEWQQLPGENWGAYRYKELLNMKNGGSNKFIIGFGEISSGGKIPLHTHCHEMALSFLSGKARVRLGARTVELGPNSAAFFPAEKPHSIEAMGTEPLQFVYTDACAELPQEIDRQSADEETTAQIDILNKSNTRWALSEDYEPRDPVEMSKGFKLRARYLFDGSRGNTQEMCVSIFDIDGGCHYTHHSHSDPEIYYVISGHGTMHVDESNEIITPGSALYIAPDVIHGLDSIGDDPLHNMVIFGEKVLEPLKNMESK